MLLTWVPLPPVSEARNLGQGVSTPEWGETPRQQHPSLLGYQGCQEEATGSECQSQEYIKMETEEGKGLLQ